MNGPKDVPAPIIVAADQAYAEINARLDEMIDIIRTGFREYPQYAHSPSLLWYRSAIDYRDKLEELTCELWRTHTHHNSADLMIAAIFRLAQDQQ